MTKITPSTEIRDLRPFLDCAMEIGEQMLISGAEVHRVEDSVRRICYAVGAVRVDVFSITSSMLLTVRDAEGKLYTQTKRVTALETDFHKLDRLNQLSRRICSEEMTAEQIRAELDSIGRIRHYPFWVECIAYALIASSFAIFFGGVWQQAIAAAVIAVILRFVVAFSDRTIKNAIFSKFLSSFALTALTFGVVRLGLASRPDEIIIGCIMLLIPGIGFTNAMRDIFTGDSIAGILRCLEAVLCALAIAGGYYLFVFLSGGAAV